MIKCLPVLFFLLTLTAQQIAAQSISEQKNKIQFQSGVTHPFHYKIPSKIICIDYCSPISLNYKFLFSALNGISYSRSLNQKNEIMTGIALSQLNYKRVLKHILSDIEEIDKITFKYYYFSIGHRYKWNVIKKLRPYIENDFILSQEVDQNFKKKSGIGLKSKLGLYFVHNNKIHFNSDVFLISGINQVTKYYIPVSYGIEAGMSFAF